MNNIKKMGEEIKKARSEASLTQREAAQKIGISHSYLSQIESGRDVNVSLENIYKIARVLDISFAYLLYLSDIVTQYKPNYDERIIPILKEKESGYIFSTFPDLKKVFPEEFKEIPHELQQELFFFLDEVKNIKESIIIELSREANFIKREAREMKGDYNEYIRATTTNEVKNELLSNINHSVVEFELSDFINLDIHIGINGKLLSKEEKVKLLKIAETMFSE